MQTKDLRTRSIRSDSFQETCSAQNKLALRTRLSPYVKDLETVVELNRKTEKQFSSVRLGFFVNKRKDIRLVVARGSTVKFQ